MHSRATDPILRPLSPVEEVIWTIDKGAPLNFVTLSRLGGNVDRDALQRGLDAACARHPLLRVRIDASGPTPVFTEERVPPLALQVVEAEAARWETLAEVQINTPIDWSSGPLVRAVWLDEGPSGGHLLLTFHHAIGDGLSGIYLTRDVLIAAFASSDDASALTPIGDTRPLYDRLPAEVRGLSGFLKRSTMGLRQAWSILTSGMAVTLRMDEERLPPERHIRLTPVVLEPEFTRDLRARCRAEETTVHGALSAAIVTAVVNDAPSGKRGSIVFGSPVDLRERVEPRPGQSVAFNAGMVEYRAPRRMADAFWPLARDLRDTLVADIDAKVPETVLTLMPRIHRLLGGERVSPRTFGERYLRLAPNTGGLTNLGRVDLPERFGEVALESLSFAVSPSYLGSFVSTATGFRGAIHWNFCWPSPCLSDDHAEALTGDVVARLRAAVVSPSP